MEARRAPVSSGSSRLRPSRSARPNDSCIQLAAIYTYSRAASLPCPFKISRRPSLQDPSSRSRTVVSSPSLRAPPLGHTPAPVPNNSSSRRKGESHAALAASPGTALVLYPKQSSRWVLSYLELRPYSTLERSTISAVLWPA